MKSTWLGEEPREVLAISIRRYARVEDVAHTIDNRGRYRDFSLFNVDLRFSQRYLAEKGVFPMGLLELKPKPVMMDDPFAMDYEQPPLSSAVLKISLGGRKGLPTFKDRLVSAAVDGDVVDGTEERVLGGIQELLGSKDPDVVYTDGGDMFALPYLFSKAKELGLKDFSLGRDRDDLSTDKKGKSYFSYGQIKYKPPSYSLRGRVHIDRTSSFMFSESGLHGLIDLSRISRIPLQEMARLSPGTAISAMQVNQALEDGCVVLWKKNVPEGFKTAEELVIADRGGFIYEPKVGIHDRVLEVDFTSLYPNIMARFNISPETVMCSCCPEPSRRVPVLGYGICDKRLGLIPRVLKPVVDRRTRLKRMVRAGIGDTKVYEERVKILKWLLVTCLDQGTEVPLRSDGRFDVLPVEDIVDRYAGDGCGEFPVDDGLQLFGVDADLVPSVKRVIKAFKFPAPGKMVELDLGRDRLRLTPDHPCFVVGDGGISFAHAADLRKGDRLPGLLPLYDGRAKGGRYISDIIIKSTRMIKPSGDHVYCFAVDGALHGFALANGVLTHNCFGYTGYKNARFGRIECHEAINAYGRELMLQASEIAEAHGFEILHGIVDSLWLKGERRPREVLRARVRPHGHTPGARRGLRLDRVPPRQVARRGRPEQVLREVRGWEAQGEGDRAEAEGRHWAREGHAAGDARALLQGLGRAAVHPAHPGRARHRGRARARGEVADRAPRQAADHQEGDEGARRVHAVQRQRRGAHAARGGGGVREPGRGREVCRARLLEQGPGQEGRRRSAHRRQGGVRFRGVRGPRTARRGEHAPPVRLLVREALRDLPK